MTTYYIIVGKMKDSCWVVCWDSEGPHNSAIYTDPYMATNNVRTWRKEETDTEFKIVTVVDYD